MKNRLNQRLKLVLACSECQERATRKKPGELLLIESKEKLLNGKDVIQAWGNESKIALKSYRPGTKTTVFL